MNKKYIEIAVNGSIVVVSEIKECNPLEFGKKKKDAQANLDKLIKGYESRIKSLEDDVKRLLGKD